MKREAIGLIETVGMATAIEAADAAIKSANVALIGYELTKGGGMVTIKISGDVGAVKAAIDAGVMAARRIGQVYGQLIIPRPHEDLDSLIKSKETVGVQAEKPEEVEVIPQEPPASELLVEEEPGEEVKEIREKATCNHCHDPACPRTRGEPKVKCIHYDPEEEGGG